MSDEIAKIEWNASYLLGVPEIDQQHKQLIAIANELYDVATGDEMQVLELDSDGNWEPIFSGRERK